MVEAAAGHELRRNSGKIGEGGHHPEVQGGLLEDGGSGGGVCVSGVPHAATLGTLTGNRRGSLAMKGRGEVNNWGKADRALQVR